MSRTRERPAAAANSDGARSAVLTTDRRHATPAEDGRDEGAAAALDAAWPLWRMAAQEHLEVLAGRGLEFTADDLVDEVGLPPVTGSPNAIGGLFMAAIHAGLIRQAGWATSRRRSRKHGVQRVWQGAPQEDHERRIA